MGVNHLWTLLLTAGQKSVPVKSLSGKTVAVDLSVWIVEFRKQHAQLGYSRLFLRTLFQRTTRLMKEGLRLVFVSDGIAPECKKDAMLARSEVSQVDVSRPWFSHLVYECRQVIENLGNPFLTAPGEAEAYCAWLNYSGYVDAVLTTDSDVFLYGGKTIYTNLESKNNGEYYCVDIYESEKFQPEFNLTRECLVAMALLVGCDYAGGGVKDIGIEKVKELFAEMKENGLDPLTRIKEWKDNQHLKTLSDWNHKKEPHCSNCSHKGTKFTHEKEGCTDCQMSRSCSDVTGVWCSCGSLVHDVKKHKLELRTRAKALQNPQFPDNRIIQEFLHANDKCAKPTIKWTPINITKLKELLPSLDICEKIAEVLVQVQLNNPQFLPLDQTLLRPHRIVKICTHKAVKCYEVEWHKLDLDTDSREFYAVKVEKTAFEEFFSNKVIDYNQQMKKKKMEKEREKKRQRVQKRKAEMCEGQSTMVQFFKVKKKSSPPPDDGKT